jgi:hypothetical protein
VIELIFHVAIGALLGVAFSTWLAWPWYKAIHQLSTYQWAAWRAHFAMRATLLSVTEDSDNYVGGVQREQLEEAITKIEQADRDCGLIQDGVSFGSGHLQTITDNRTKND